VHPCANAIGYGAKYEPGANIGSVVSADAEIECTRGIDYGYTLHEKSASGATNTGYTTVDRGAANTTSGGYAVNLQVFSATGTSSPTLSVVVEHSTNGTRVDNVGHVHHSSGGFSTHVRAKDGHHVCQPLRAREVGYYGGHLAFVHVPRGTRLQIVNISKQPSSKGVSLNAYIRSR
jgi:hypothetical protein